MAENYTPIQNGEPMNAATLNSRWQEIDDAIEAMLAGTKTLAAPDIVSFANSAHDHQDAAGAAKINADAIDSEDADSGDILGQEGWVAREMPASHHDGFTLTQVAADRLIIGTGSAVIRGQTANKDVMTELLPSRHGDWIEGLSAEAASLWLWVYMNEEGVIRFHDAAPNLSAPYSANVVCQARIAQAGWNGTAGLGLSASPFIIDDGAGGAPPGETNIMEGMYALIYSDSNYELGRGKGSAAAAALNEQSAITIIGYDAATHSVSVGGAHRVALFDNDHVLIVEAGYLDYRLIDGVYWYALGAIWNDGSGNLSALRTNQGDKFTANQGSDYSIASATLTAVDSTNMALKIFVRGRRVKAGFTGSCYVDAQGGVYLEIQVDDHGIYDDGMVMMYVPTAALLIVDMSFTRMIEQNIVGHLLEPGSHTFTLRWKRTGTGTAKLWAGAGTANLDIHPTFWVKEVTDQ